MASPPAAIVVAGGSGLRAGPGPPKQFRPLGRRPVYSWSVAALADAGCAPIVLVVPPERVEEVAGLHAGDLRVVGGGPERQDSVAAGLEAVDAEVVVVHDAVRPLVTADLVVRVVGGLGPGVDGCIAAIPESDTLKRVVGEGVVERTVDRAGLWRTQTPGAFRTVALRRALRKASEEGFVGTDDAQLIERDGGSVRVVEGSARNLKITRPDDFELAEALSRGEGP